MFVSGNFQQPGFFGISVGGKNWLRSKRINFKKKKIRIEIFDRISFLVQQIFEFLFEIAHIEKTQHTKIRVVASNTRIIMIFCRPSLPRTSNRWVRSTIKLFCTVHSLSTARIQVWLESV